MIEEGKAYTAGNSFRARAEAQQRRFRANELKLPQGRYGHWLRDEDAARGANFYGRAYEVASKRARDGKGVNKARTMGNMLSSQAMCFNIFGNLLTEDGLALATTALQKFTPTIHQVKQIDIEYTPNKDVFGDQSGQAGVDCDVLIEYIAANGEGGLLAVETKFVEEEFSACGFRKNVKKADPGRISCSEGTRPGNNFDGCLYVSRKHYGYWDQSRRLGTLRPDVLEGDQPCPFGDGMWQLWVNHTLVHAEASKRKLKEAFFAVCAPKGNDKLLKGERIIDDFKKYLADPASMLLIELEDFIDALQSSAGPDHQKWIDYLKQRYVIRDQSPSNSAGVH
ncbi:MAG TPA: hypothetical protein VLH60_00825 [Sedimentisphaerales bacterium]|nr:hypothetical protein [Sedimentisphaerales bacterium]